jgi:hypothetical protein
MAMRNSGLAASKTGLLPLPVDVDFVRFETNLLQIGFFSAEDSRAGRPTRRRFEQTVTRQGKRIQVAVEFGSEQGLPSTADRDKFLALMKIVSEERARQGVVQNPIRFSGYRLLKELGLSNSGNNYEDIYAWGRRLAATTITSQQVIYYAVRKRYSDETIHVFSAFRRVGHSKLDESEKTETYEVELEGWLLENINSSYVIPEDFKAYKSLNRPIAKGIFGNLHLWFHASNGRPVEKDYVELCRFLAVNDYPHPSKIRSTMGKSLDELVGVGYISSWQLQPMATKKGYKIVMTPGTELQRVLAMTNRKALVDKSPSSGELSSSQQDAIGALIENGVAPSKAKSLVQEYDPDLVMDQIEHALSQMDESSSGSKRKINNPAGFIIYTIENSLPVPATFLTSRKKRQLEIEQDKEREALRAGTQYAEWKDGLINAEISARFPGDDLKHKLREIISDRKRTDEHFRVLPVNVLEKLALNILKKEMEGELSLPDFDSWIKDQKQGQLF